MSRHLLRHHYEIVAAALCRIAVCGNSSGCLTQRSDVWSSTADGVRASRRTKGGVGNGLTHPNHPPQKGRLGWGLVISSFAPVRASQQFRDGRFLMRPTYLSVVLRVVRQLHHAAPICVHQVGPPLAVTVGGEGDAAAVRRPAWPPVGRGFVC